MAGSCECGNEPSGDINCGEFLDQLKTCKLLMKDSAPLIYLVTELLRWFISYLASQLS